MNRKGTAVRTSLIGLALAAVCVVAAPRAEIIEQVLVKVNGEIFTKTDLEQRQVAALRQLGQQGNVKSDPSANVYPECKRSCMVAGPRLIG